MPDRLLGALGFAPLGPLTIAPSTLNGVKAVKGDREVVPPWPICDDVVGAGRIPEERATGDRDRVAKLHLTVVTVVAGVCEDVPAEVWRPQRTASMLCEAGSHPGLHLPFNYLRISRPQVDANEAARRRATNEQMVRRWPPARVRPCPPLSIDTVLPECVQWSVRHRLQR